MARRANHDRYGKQILGDILGKRWITRFDDRKSVEMAGVRADLDGIILTENHSDLECAVEIEATVYTQARSALLSLALHPAPKKLFVVILAQSQMGTKETAARHFRLVWEKLSPISKSPFALAVLQGTGALPKPEEDRVLIERALLELNVLPQ